MMKHFHFVLTCRVKEAASVAVVAKLNHYCAGEIYNNLQCFYPKITDGNLRMKFSRNTSVRSLGIKQFTRQNTGILAEIYQKLTRLITRRILIQNFA